MPFDGTDSRDWNPGPDPAPPWWQRAACRTALTLWAAFYAVLWLSVCVFVAAVAPRGWTHATTAAACFVPFLWLCRMVRRDVRALMAGRWP